MVWVALSLTAAVGSASVSLVLKRAVEQGGVLLSTVLFRLVAGLLLLGLVLASGSTPVLTPKFWWMTALVIPPEIIGMLCLSMALRTGELSMVQPMMGLIPMVVMAGGMLLLGEVPTLYAGAGILLVTSGVYFVGLQRKGSLLAPLRQLVRSRAGGYTLGAVVAWSITTLLHKFGIAEVGPLPWAVTLTLGSALALAVSLPFLRWRKDVGAAATRSASWSRLLLLGGLLFALQQIGLQTALQMTQAGYVVAVTATSILWATAFGIFMLGERASARSRAAGALLISCGAALIALFG